MRCPRRCQNSKSWMTAAIHSAERLQSFHVQRIYDRGDQTYRLKDSSSWTDDVQAAELFYGNGKSSSQLRPVRYVRFLKESPCFGSSFPIDKSLGFWQKGQVRDDDVTAIGNEDLREFKTYTRAATCN